VHRNIRNNFPVFLATLGSALANFSGPQLRFGGAQRDVQGRSTLSITYVVGRHGSGKTFCLEAINNLLGRHGSGLTSADSTIKSIIKASTESTFPFSLDDSTNNGLDSENIRLLANSATRTAQAVSGAVIGQPIAVPIVTSNFMPEPDEAAASRIVCFEMRDNEDESAGARREVNEAYDSFSEFSKEFPTQLGCTMANSAALTLLPFAYNENDKSFINICSEALCVLTNYPIRACHDRTVRNHATCLRVLEVCALMQIPESVVVDVIAVVAKSLHNALPKADSSPLTALIQGVRLSEETNKPFFGKPFIDFHNRVEYDFCGTKMVALAYQSLLSKRGPLSHVDVKLNQGAVIEAAKKQGYKVVPQKFAILSVLTERMQIDSSEPEMMPRRRTFDELPPDTLMKQLAICMPKKDYEKAYNYQSEQKTFSEWQDAVAKSPFLKKLYETDMLKTALPSLMAPFLEERMLYELDSYSPEYATGFSEYDTSVSALFNAGSSGAPMACPYKFVASGEGVELEPDETKLYQMGYMHSMLVKPSEVDEQSPEQDASADMTEDLSVSGSNLAEDVESGSILSDLPLSTYDDVQIRSMKRHRAVAPSDDTSDAESPAGAKVSWYFLSLSSKYSLVATNTAHHTFLPAMNRHLHLLPNQAPLSFAALTFDFILSSRVLIGPSLLAGHLRGRGRRRERLVGRPADRRRAGLRAGQVHRHQHVRRRVRRAMQPGRADLQRLPHL